VRDGYEKAQVAQIAAAAGRTKGAVYAHFRNKCANFLSRGKAN
jgi:AcrR family transcriptional regulator